MKYLKLWENWVDDKESVDDWLRGLGLGRELSIEDGVDLDWRTHPENWTREPLSDSNPDMNYVQTYAYPSNRLLLAPKSTEYPDNPLYLQRLLFQSYEASLTITYEYLNESNPNSSRHTCRESWSKRTPLNSDTFDELLKVIKEFNWTIISDPQSLYEDWTQRFS